MLDRPTMGRGGREGSSPVEPFAHQNRGGERIMRRIAVVGGGPGGLFTAWLLGQKCAEKPDITLFEASPRLGGKVLTKRFAAAPVFYEAGAAELYQYGNDPLQ